MVEGRQGYRKALIAADDNKKGKGKGTVLRSVTCHMGSHSVTCHPTQVNTPRLNPSQRGWYGTRFTYTEGMEG